MRNNNCVLNTQKLNMGSRCNLENTNGTQRNVTMSSAEQTEMPNNNEHIVPETLKRNNWTLNTDQLHDRKNQH